MEQGAGAEGGGAMARREVKKQGGAKTPPSSNKKKDKDKKKKKKKQQKASSVVSSPAASETQSATKKVVKKPEDDEEKKKKRRRSSEAAAAEQEEEEEVVGVSGEEKAEEGSSSTPAAASDDEEVFKEGPEAWRELGLHEALVEAACNGLKWTKPTAIQRGAIPEALKGRDVVGLAETGSGKTGAFALPILHRLLQKPTRLFAVCLAPTRELAVQIHEVFEALGRGIGLRSVCVVGGIDMVQQAVALAKMPHVVVATPGRLVDHMENTKGFTLRNTKCLVMDEADRMLSMDFEKELVAIVGAMPSEGRSSMLFSATMTSKVAKLQRASLVDPFRVEVNDKFAMPRQLIQQYLFVPAKYKDCYLAYVLHELAGQTTLIFAATCSGAQRIALLLRNLGFNAVCLHGQMPQPKRLGALRKFKAKESSILVATDVASRGLDIPSVDLVLNYDIPSHGKEYIHRVGRTARAGRAGRAVALVTQYDVEIYQRLEHLIGSKLPAFPADEESALVFLDRVGEAQRLATIAMRESGLGLGGKGKNGFKKNFGDGDDDDDEEGAVANQKQDEVFGGHRKNKKFKKRR